MASDNWKRTYKEACLPVLWAEKWRGTAREGVFFAFLEGRPHGGHIDCYGSFNIA
jgi:hypothetical protein